MSLDPSAVLAGVLQRTLPKPQWTHEAHVAACWAAIRAHGHDDALTLLRDGIRRYNEATGVENTETSGYHETITRYYVAAVAAIVDRPFAEVLADETTSREAPLCRWSREVLFAPGARTGWVEPDLVPR
ncbi:MAG: hypothetical protein AAF081_05910 [Actinomycetota bacterium]